MSGSSSAQTDGIWPGYVAAMASLMLSLVLVLAVLAVTISQIGSLSDSYDQAILRAGFGSREQVERLAKVTGITDDNTTTSPTSTTSPVSTTSPTSSAAQQATADFIAGRLENSVLDLRLANFDRDAARNAAEWVARDKNLLQQIDLSQVNLEKLNYTKLDISKIDLSKNLSPDDLKKIDFSQVDLGNLTAKRVEALKPFLAKEGIRYQLLVQSKKKPASVATDNATQLKAPTPSPKAETAKLAPVVAQVPAQTPSPEKPEKLFITFIEESMEPLPQQKQQIVVALSRMKQDSAGVRIWTHLPNDDMNLRRTAYARLTSLRTMAVEAGFPPAAIKMDIETVSGMPALQREMTLYAAVKPK